MAKRPSERNSERTAIRAVSSLSRLKITAGNALHHLSVGFGAAAGPHVCQVEEQVTLWYRLARLRKPS